MIYVIDVAEKRKVRDISKCVYNFTVGLWLHIKTFQKIYSNKLSNSIKQRRFFFFKILHFIKIYVSRNYLGIDLEI